MDGSGGPGRVMDVRIQGDRIVEVGALRPRRGETVVSARGLVVAPGFIDAHSHADRGIDEDPLAGSQLTQGITTAVVGQDGIWRKPVREELADLAKRRPAINFAIFSGHGGIRDFVLGEEYKRVATQPEMEAMKRLVAQDMRDGALGLSTGLEYDPGYYSDTDEVVELSKVAARWNGLYISHMRDEADRVFAATDELLEIGRRANARAQISHVKLGSRAVWGKAGRITDILKRRDITADVYPYLFWQSTIAALTPSRDWENRAIWVKALSDVGGPQNVRLTRYTHEPKWIGKTLAEIASMTGRDPIAIIREILRRTKGPGGSGSQSVAVTAMQERDLKAFVQDPRVMFCSDGSIGGSHPRGAGSFPRVLGLYVREKKWLRLEEAVRRMTSFPAETLGIPDRGLLAPGKFADVVVFDPKRIRDRATAENPTEWSVGVRDVWVNGTRVLRGGQPSGARSGLALRRGANGLQTFSPPEMPATRWHTHGREWSRLILAREAKASGLCCDGWH